MHSKKLKQEANFFLQKNHTPPLKETNWLLAFARVPLLLSSFINIRSNGIALTTWLRKNGIVVFRGYAISFAWENWCWDTPEELCSKLFI